MKNTDEGKFRSLPPHHMTYDDQYNIFDFDLSIKFICNNLYLFLVLTSKEWANYLGAQHHHAYVSCMIICKPGREYMPGFHEVFNNTHDKCFNT